MRKYDYIIIGAGIIGLTIARELKKREPEVSICIVEKESDVAAHASGRNSGVLHAGFYYSANSLKAKFTKEGNQAMRAYCKLNGLQLNECGKLVVAKDETELAGLEELKLRADINGVQLIWMNEQEIASIDPNAKTYRKALYSPTTASVDPVEVCRALKRENVENGVEFHFLTKYRKHRGDLLFTSSGTFKYSYLINCAGLYADSIAHDFGFGQKYTIIPFKGIYLKYTKNKTDVVTNIYPVPNLKNPFLGVHYTKTVDGSIKIGPTAMPAFWRENYQGLQGFNLKEFLQIVGFELKLFITNSFHFRRLAFQEMRKYIKSYFIGLGMGMVREIDPKGFGHFLRPGIRAQLLNVETLELVQDFVIEGDKRSMHVLNAVSPAFTCSMPFAAYVVDQIMKQRGGALS
ncbi:MULTISPECIES: L-2-hydroxyglutarate oxidase [Paenibacillus]|uniref:L-2-hydroxyglutarate oxidase n=1 Tax=Paenibacillus violae TaxID=3077234 RepID=A0ABU3RH41_9BACL|nr:MULTISPECIES: L-2-hydroxyglutarate oxidase [Paenibacillus]MDU0203572.1 L-2-hydroxyglutarate oxidase [Paenibacillus sp. PFR10]MEC0267333.1 L-2-hydroxyglutarate oxidase [Paenibacillus anseongense]